MAAAQRRNLRRQLATLYAWVATIAGREELITVDLPAPGGIGSRPLLLVTDNRPEAMRFAPHARRHLEAVRQGDPVSRVDLLTFARHTARPVATLRAARTPSRS